MLLKYHTPKRPYLLVAVETHGHSFFYPMILDTGADSTCFPADLAAVIGHDNDGEGVSTLESTGIGGVSACYLHTVSLSLLDPSMPLSKSPRKKRVWTSPIEQYLFVEKLTSSFGLLGRDVMRHWKSVAIAPARGAAWTITIRV